jgi:RNA polymerase subunit RPABC4/transcription elongation factor Spt4
MSVLYCHDCDRRYDEDFHLECPGCGTTEEARGAHQLVRVHPEQRHMHGTPPTAAAEGRHRRRPNDPLRDE